MDLTPLFKACIRTVKTRNKMLSVITNGNTNDLKKSDKHSILNANTKSLKSSQQVQKSEFTARALEVVRSISSLKEFIFKHRRSYIITNDISNELGATLTDEQRDQIEQDAEHFIRLCSDTIMTLHQLVNMKNTNNQTAQHREGVIKLVDNYLKTICKFYTEQKAIRVKKAVDQKRLGRLEPGSSKRRKTDNSSSDRTGPLGQGASVTKTNVTTLETEASHTVDEMKDFGLTTEEIQTFEEENEELYDELNCLVDEVKQIEGKVVEISKLQEIFTEKVLEQDKQVDTISSEAVAASENIKEGNEQVRKALEQRAGTRVYLLFFLIIMSFALLFLDWYNP